MMTSDATFETNVEFRKAVEDWREESARCKAWLKKYLEYQQVMDRAQKLGDELTMSIIEVPETISSPTATLEDIHVNGCSNMTSPNGSA